MKRFNSTKLILLSILFPAVLPATAKIKYTDVNPDTTITATVTQLFASYNIDLNKDGVVDFYIKHFHPSATNQQAEFYTEVGQAGEVLVDGTNGPLALNKGDNISSTQTQWVNEATSMSSTALQMAGNWAGKSDKYVAVRIKVAGHWNYGWVRITIPVDVSGITIKDFAVNDIADSPIHAGQVVPTSVQDITNNTITPVTVYPNPLKTSATIRCTVMNSELGIFNGYGQKIRTIHFTTKDTTELKRGDLAAGMYYYQLTQNGTHVTSGKICITD